MTTLTYAFAVADNVTDSSGERKNRWLKISWIKANPDELVQVYRNTINNRDDINTQQVAVQSGAEYVDMDVVEGTTYYYWVRALNPSGVENGDFYPSSPTAGLAVTLDYIDTPEIKDNAVSTISTVAESTQVGLTGAKSSGNYDTWVEIETNDFVGNGGAYDLISTYTITSATLNGSLAFNEKAFVNNRIRIIEDPLGANNVIYTSFSHTIFSTSVIFGNVQSAMLDQISINTTEGTTYRIQLQQYRRHDDTATSAEITATSTQRTYRILGLKK